MGKIDKNSMALFVKVVEQESFTKTASIEGLPLSTVSRKISELEKALGVRLLERSTRQLRVTHIGEEYYQSCKRGLEEFEAANTLVIDHRAEVNGQLRLSAPPALSDNLLLPLIDDFISIYPKVSVKCMVTERYVDHISEGMDVAFRVGKLSDSRLIARKLLRYRSQLVASREYIDKAGEPLHPREVPLHRIIAFSAWNKSVVWEFEKGESRQEISLDPQITINDYAGVMSAVREGRGISEIPSIIGGAHVHCGDLIEVMQDWRLPPTDLSAVYPSGKHLARVVRVFLDYCVENIASYTPHLKID